MILKIRNIKILFNGTVIFKRWYYIKFHLQFSRKFIILKMLYFFVLTLRNKKNEFC